MEAPPPPPSPHHHPQRARAHTHTSTHTQEGPAPRAAAYQFKNVWLPLAAFNGHDSGPMAVMAYIPQWILSPADAKT